MESFFIALNAVIPFIFYLTFGGFMRKTGLVDEPFLRKMNMLIFHAFFPLMMFDNIYTMGEGGGLRPFFLVFSMAGEILLLIISLFIVQRVVKDRRRVAVIIQAIYRSNILFFAVPLSRSLYGEAAVGIVTAIVVFVVPMYNMTAVLLFEAFSGREHSSPGKLLLNVIKTPLVAGLITAVPFRLLHIHIPDMLYTPVAQFSDATVPLALFVLGGTLRFSSLKKNMNTVTAVFILKLILVPAIMLAVTSCFGFTNMERFVIFTLYSTPMATSVFSMAQGMNADSELAGEIIVVTTVGSVITLFLWIFGMNSFGML